MRAARRKLSGCYGGRRSCYLPLTFGRTVLEASWRSGGASTAELTVLAAFVQSPGLQVVEASAIKEFGKGRDAPRGAIVHFRGDDPEDGPIVRYTLMTRALRRAA